MLFRHTLYQLSYGDIETVVGIEPTFLRLQLRALTVWLHSHIYFNEQYLATHFTVSTKRFELLSLVSETSVLPLDEVEKNIRSDLSGNRTRTLRCDRPVFSPIKL